MGANPEVAGLAHSEAVAKAAEIRYIVQEVHRLGAKSRVLDLGTGRRSNGDRFRLKSRPTGRFLC